MIAFTTPQPSNRQHWQLMLCLPLALSVWATNTEAAPKNIKPAARIPYIAPVIEQTKVTLDGNDSFDKDGSIVKYTWLQTGKPLVDIANVDSALATFTAPVVKKTTKLSFILAVTDNLGAVTKAKRTVTIKPINKLPSANAGEDQTVLLNSQVTLNGTSSKDNDGQIKSWQWKQIAGPKVNLKKANTNSPNFLGPKEPAQLSFRLTVIDDEKGKAQDEVSITVQKDPVIVPNASVNLESKDFTDNSPIIRGTSQTLTWTVKNTSNISLSNVELTPGTATGGLLINEINPKTIASWGIGETKTLSVLVTAPTNAAAATHSQSWLLSYDGGKPLPFSNSTDAIKFSLVTEPTVEPPVNVALGLENKNFTDNEVLTRDASGNINRSLTWTIKNNSDIDLANVVLTANTPTGGLTIGTISPSNLANWAKGESQTFSTTATATSSLGAGTHSQTWSFTYNGGKPVPFDNGQALGFTLKTEAAIDCTGAATPTAQASAAPNFSKIDAAGLEQSKTSNQWACVLDKNTGLMWEAKTDDNGLHDKDWTYSWFQPNTANNPGVANAGDCGNNGNGCDTESYVQAVNSEALCGHSDWRMPTDEELLSLVSPTQTEPAINTNFFPLTQNSMYWSASSTEDGLSAWYVSFGKGYHAWNLKDSPRYVRLVR